LPRFDSPSLTWRPVRPFVFALATVTLAFALLACGGDDDDSPGDGGDATSAAGTGTAAPNATSTAPSGGAGGSVDTADGDRIAHEAMISETDLPGTGWTVVATDEFGSSLLEVEEDDEFRDIPACNSYVARIEGAAQEAEAARAGRASKSFSRTDSFFGSSVDVEVNVYDDPSVADNLINEAEGAFASTEFEECFQAVFSESSGEIPEEVEFSLEVVDPLRGAPNGGVAQAFNMELSSAGVSFSLHAELYAWSNGNATAFVSIFGDPESVTIELVDAAVGKTDEKLSDAQ
jgi:hypothetical protein